jgi:hypothetical protein
MSRNRRQLSMLLALPLAALLASAVACGSEGSLSVLENLEANPDNKSLPPADVFAQWETPDDPGVDGASATLLAAAAPRLSAAAELPLGTALMLGDDACKAVPLGFTYIFYGITFNTVFVCANGNITLNANNPSRDGLLPQPNVRMLAPANGDWTPDLPTGGVYVQTLGQAPGRRFIVTWQNIKLFNSPSQGALRSTFRAILHESSNLAELQYPSVREVRTDKMRAGISAGTTNFLLVASGTQLLQLTGKSICFSPTVGGYARTDEPCPLVAPPNAAPIADAGGPYAAEEGSPIPFNGSLSSDPDGDALGFAWTFGDGAVAAGQQTSHVYVDQGAYPVSLTVTDPAGLTSQSAVLAHVYNVAPSVAVDAGGWLSTGNARSAASSVVSGEVVTLSAGFSDPGVVDAPWTWTVVWGDGGTYTGTSADWSSSAASSRRGRTTSR